MSNFMKIKLDRIDRHILELMQSDASISNAEIAERVGLSAPPCWRRVKRLTEAGIIDKKVNILNAKALGLNVTVFATVKLSAHGRKMVNEFRKSIESFAEVTECYVLLGAVDVLLRIVVSSVEAYEHFFNQHLSQISGVQEVHSSVVMTEIKHTTALPLHLLS
jgi:Lrp/AsnC family transcriptional regulator